MGESSAMRVHHLGMRLGLGRSTRGQLGHPSPPQSEGTFNPFAVWPPPESLRTAKLRGLRLRGIDLDLKAVISQTLF